MRIPNVACWFRSAAMRSIAGELKDKTGAALVETALSVTILSTLLVGAAEFGRLIFAAIEVTNAAMAGVHYGVQSASNAGDVTGIQNAAANEAGDITLGTTAVSHTCICSDGSASTCLSTDCSSSHIETILTVQTQTTITPAFRLPGLPSTYTLHGQAVEKVLQ